MKKIPQRRCVGCSISKNKIELIRIVRGPNGDVSVDRTGKKSGRGAYICKDETCLKKALKSRKIERDLEIKLSEELMEKLQSEIRAD